MGESSNVMSNDARIQLVKSKHRKIKFRDTMLSVSGIALFFLIWELLVVTGTVDSKKLCDVLEIFKLFIVKLTDPNPDGAVLIVNIWSSLQIALCGFGLALILFCGVRKALEHAKTPKCFEGLPITLVAAALTSMTFMGFAGMADKLFG